MMTSRNSAERGAALLTAMVAVAVLTAVATDLAYSSRVSLQIAANARDELRANWRARSGVTFSRLVLSLQKQLDDSMPPGAGIPMPRIQIWRLIPVGSTLADGLFPPAGPSAGPSTEGGAEARPASFEATIEDEGRKVNAQLEGYVQTGDRKLWQRVQSLYQLICDARWDPLFDREDARGVRSTREDILVRLRDWVDENSVTSSLVVGGGSSTTCGMVPGLPPFEDAFGDENQPYDRGEDRYRAKNARMDSLDELYLVAGVGDAFMAAFGDSLTVYPNLNDKQNVNDLDRARLVQFARTVAENPLNPVLLDPAFGQKLQKAIFEKTMGGIFSITASDLGTAIELAGVRVNRTLLADGPNSPFTDTSLTYRIRAKGTAGSVRTTIDAVVRIVPMQPGQTAPAQPLLIHWRED
jgi:general secretion pathway protein K